MGGGVSAGARGPGRTALPAPDRPRRRVHDARRRKPRQPPASGAVARTHPRPLRHRAREQPAQLSRASDPGTGDRAAWRTRSTPSAASSRLRRTIANASCATSDPTRNSCPRWSPKTSPGRNSRASICICRICSGIVPDVGQTRDYPYGDVLSPCAGLCRRGVRERHAGRRRSRAVAARLPHRQARHRESL